MEWREEESVLGVLKDPVPSFQNCKGVNSGNSTLREGGHGRHWSDGGPGSPAASLAANSILQP